MKVKSLLIVVLVIFTMVANAQIKVTDQGNFVIPESPNSMRFGNTTHESAPIGEWGIEYFNGGLNIFKPWPTYNNGNYKLFLKNNGNVGIGINNPSQKLSISGGELRLK